MAVYLNHESSKSSDAFYQILCSKSVVELLSSDFVIWGLDLTESTKYQNKVFSYLIYDFLYFLN